MKLRTFSPESIAFVNDICSTDMNQSDEELVDIFRRKLQQFESELNTELLETKYTKKPWRKKRRELSLFFELFGVMNAKDPKKIYNSFIRLASGEIMKDPEFMQVACMIGLVFFTIDDVEMLIKHNENTLGENMNIFKESFVLEKPALVM